MVLCILVLSSEYVRIACSGFVIIIIMMTLFQRDGFFNSQACGVVSLKVVNQFNAS